jgi:hypothetical protein
VVGSQLPIGQIANTAVNVLGTSEDLHWPRWQRKGEAATPWPILSGNRQSQRIHGRAERSKNGNNMPQKSSCDRSLPPSPVIAARKRRQKEAMPFQFQRKWIRRCRLGGENGSLRVVGVQISLDGNCADLRTFSAFCFQSVLIRSIESACSL